jgi:hypothetical protein
MNMRHPKEGDYIDLTKKIETPDFSIPSKWKPNVGETHTMLYGRGTPTPVPTTEELADRYVAQYYPYLLKGSDDYTRRYNEFLNR